MSQAFATIAGGLPYGWQILYVAKVEGYPVLLVEASLDAVAPSGYTIDPVLVVDDSAAVGSEVDRETGLGRGYDLTLRLLESAGVRAMVAAPTYRARLTAGISPDDVTIAVDSTTGWPESGTLHIGRQAITYNSTGATTFDECDDDVYGRAYPYTLASAVGTMVTSSPVYWLGREVRLYAVPVDPWGHVSGANVLTNASLVWSGHIAEQPMPEGDGFWTISCRALDRRLADPAAPGITGKAVWSLESDPAVVMTVALKTAQLQVYLGWHGDTAYYADAPYVLDMQPWNALSQGTAYRLSVLRKAVVDAFATTWATYFAAAAFDPVIEWRTTLVSLGSGYAREWRAFVFGDWTGIITSAYTEPAYVQIVQQHGDCRPVFQPSLTNGPKPVTNIPNVESGTSKVVRLYTLLTCRADVTCGALTVRVDGAAVGDVPSTGAVLVESAGHKDVYRYTAITLDAGHPDEVILTLAPQSGPDLAQLAQVELAGGEPAEVTATICGHVAGFPAVAMMTVLESPGGAANGNYGTGTAGYDLERVDEASFLKVLGSGMAQTAGDVVLVGKASFGDLFGGLLALSRHAVVGRAAVDGSAYELTAVETGQSPVGPYAATITDASLASTSTGTQPVRALRQVRWPTGIEIKTSRWSDETEGRIIVTDTDRQRAEGLLRWELEIPGYAREALAIRAAVWGRSLLALGVTGQAVEVDTAPWLAADVGDAVLFTTAHHAVYSRATGARGYSGPARVLGRKLDLASGLVTLTLLLDGQITKAMRLCPSAPILSWTGAASAATGVEISGDYQTLMDQALSGAASVELLAYIPGSDVADSQRFTVTAAVDTGANCMLTVSAQTGAFTITTEWFVAWPATATDNTAQAAYLHTDSAAGWA